MNALRHGLAAATIISTGVGGACASPADEVYKRLWQIETERTKIFDKMGDMSELIDLGTSISHLRQLVALERYAQRVHSKLKKQLLWKRC